MNAVPEYRIEGSATRAAVVLVHYGDPAMTWRCVRSLLAHTQRPFAIFIADHGPGVPLGDDIPQDCSTSALTVFRSENLGFAHGCNRAAEAAYSKEADYVWFFNNDATIGDDTLGALLDLAADHPDVGVWGTHQLDHGRIIGSDQLPRWFQTHSFTSRRVEGLPEGCHQLSARETLSGASMLVSRRAWDQLGPWPEWCFLYYEDVAWGLRAHTLGIPVVLTDLSVIHPRNSSTGRHSPVSTYYGVRNSLLLHGDLWPEKRLARAVQSLHYLQKRIFQGNWRMLPPTWRAICDAWHGKRYRI